MGTRIGRWNLCNIAATGSLSHTEILTDRAADCGNPLRPSDPECRDVVKQTGPAS